MCITYEKFFTWLRQTDHRGGNVGQTLFERDVCTRHSDSNRAGVRVKHQLGESIRIYGIEDANVSNGTCIELLAGRMLNSVLVTEWINVDTLNLIGMIAFRAYLVHLITKVQLAQELAVDMYTYTVQFLIEGDINTE